jgi:uncharacterized membrane protein
VGGCKIVCDKGISMLIIEASEIRGNVLYIKNETGEGPFVFKPTRKGDDQKLEFLLYKNPFGKSVYGKEDEKEPYRTLHLWLDVT